METLMVVEVMACVGTFTLATMVGKGTLVKMVGLQNSPATLGVGIYDHRHCCCCCCCCAVKMGVVVASPSHLHGGGGCRVIVETGHCCHGVCWCPCLPHPFH